MLGTFLTAVNTTWNEKKKRRRTRMRRRRDEKEIMGVLLVSRVTARFLRKFKQSCRRGTSRGRVQKARRTSTLISQSFLRARPTRFLICFFSSLSSSLSACVIFLLRSDFLHFRCNSDVNRRYASGHANTVLRGSCWNVTGSFGIFFILLTQPTSFASSTRMLIVSVAL